MTYKIKSFLYFLCFAIAAFIYNKVEQENKRFQEQVNSSSIVETDIEGIDDLQETQEDLVKDLE
ncbi:MAG: hypothetical protein AB3N18_07580 [Allomuricauda sp.]